MRIDQIIENGQITTLSAERPRAERIGVLNGRIVGFDSDLDGIEARERIDLNGQHAVPGFHDAHIHLAGLGGSLRSLDLSAASVPTLDALYAAVENAAAKAQPGEWVIGRGFNQIDLGSFPELTVLDRICRGHPVYLSQVSGHVAVVNTAAFNAAGIENPDTASDPEGGVIVRENGIATGVVKEKAQDPFNQVTKNKTEADLLEELKLASDYALSLGLTSFTEPGIGQDRHGVGMGKSSADVHYYQLARERGLLNLRGTLMPTYNALHDLGEPTPGEPGWGMDFGVRSGFGDEWLKFGAFKVQIDGSFSGYSALLKSPYRGYDQEYGVCQWEPAELTEHMVQLHRLGWQIGAHAIGDAGVEIVVRAMEIAQQRYPRKDPRHRIEHCGLAEESLVRRIIDAGIIPVPQGSFIGQFGDNYIEVLGQQRAQRSWPMGSFVNNGAIIPGSTDAPVTHASPLYSMECMVTRKTPSGETLGPEESLSTEQALRAYTYGSAYADHDEKIKGTLEAGKLADLTVLGEDLACVTPEEIKNIPVMATIVGGEVKYAA